MPRNYNLQNGATVSVADNPLGEGGEGAVYEILGPANYRNSVAKILYPEKRTNERRYKVRYMVDNPPSNIQDGNGHNFLIWPQHLLLDNTDFIGFIMPKAEGIDLEELRRVKLKPELGVEWQKFNRSNPDSKMLRLILCNNIAKAVNSLHATGRYVIGDLKPENVRVKSNGTVTILDLDSCQITEGGQIRFNSKMNTPMYSPPDIVTEQKEFSWDYFILSIIFYEILCGIHPFTGTAREPFENHNTPEQKIHAGLFPFGSKSHYFEVIGRAHYSFKSLPVSVQKLFIQCFDDGIALPANRPSATEWINNLTAKPKVVLFESNRTTIVAGLTVTLNWEVEGAEEIEITGGVGKVNKAGSITIKPQSDIRYEITAKNIFGVDQKSISLVYFPTPIMESLKVPMPDFPSSLNISPISISAPNVNVTINIQSPKFTDMPTSFVNLNRISFQKGAVNTNEEFNWNISEVYNKIKNKLKR